MRVDTGGHHGRRRSGSHESTGGHAGRRRSGSHESPTVHDARLHMTRRLREAWTDAFVLFPVRDLDLLARATPAVMRLQPSPKTFPQLLAALRSVAEEYDDHELIDAMAPIQYRLDKDLAEDQQDPGPAVAGSPARWLPRQDSTGSAGAASPGGGRRTTQRRHARSPRPAPGAAPAPAPSSSSRRDRHRRRRQQTEAAHRRALARLDRLRLPDTTPNPYAAKAGKRRSTG